MSKGTFGFGMLIGALAGYAAASFLAPKPGKETQEEWKAKAEEYVEKAKQQGTQLKEKVTPSKDGGASDDISVYSTNEGVGDATDALAVDQQFHADVPAPETPEAPIPPTSPTMTNGVAEDVRYREADPLEHEPRP